MVRPLNCIVAVSQNMGIGKDGNLPWPPLRYLLSPGGWVGRESWTGAGANGLWSGHLGRVGPTLGEEEVVTWAGKS